ncbi:MAG TPA: CAP domain-containing protein [Phnomibacter sp.]|nr:CAP domain-containing protein [Phnomibacter sp.]
MFMVIKLFTLCLAFFFDAPEDINPLEAFDPVWKDAKYRACNTAKNTRYLTPKEKEVIYVLNLARQYPQQFNQTIVKPWPGKRKRPHLMENSYYLSLQADLAKMRPAPLLRPDSTAWVSAQCHALTSGKMGYTGHDRQTAACKAKERFDGECCHYGSNNALNIIMSLLIDDGVPSLGHRFILLRENYKGIGVSIQPHATYDFNTVLNLTF